MRCGLIGEKLSHSYSKIIHNRIASYDYALYSLSPEQLEPFVLAKNYRGMNVTIPYKKQVIPLCDALSDTAKKIGSVNTLVVGKDGTLLGDNTDYDGFCYLAKRTGVDFADKKAVILGSGGTSLTAQAAAWDLGARDVVVVSRRGAVCYEDTGAYADGDILINTTPVGMYPENDGLPVDIAQFSHLCGVLDAVYNPLRTRLVLQAMRAGIPAAGGLAMLVAQATAASARFTGEKACEEKNESVLRELLCNLQNIVLVGMPGSGKTSVGGAVCAALGRELVDTDARIAQSAGCSIPDIFAQSDEAHFRQLESEAVKECAKMTGKVIATGGGVVLSAENTRRLAQNGRVYYLMRALCNLDISGRPLSKDLETLAQMQKIRQPYYESCADAVVDNSGTVDAACKNIVEDFYETIGD